ncbi:Uncharacterised protein [Streptococcus pyogenes]|uniref:hypothetical protein n=1 Tax=Streptococcus pyogenes TaxID=1314 RepID=UPI00109D63DD|nr:hypothetical protein [Streptococcus pyogenes]VGV31260.1 Uncharacterised protein [Streptococcus pyogenes]VHA71821.1 Uncharacterised protein [Streptococcus pyogenes]VHC47904.1 Uncharacterised protein [Streptococcus pyogenes]VHD05401.1 Uncharacterised protein [Streptococcus pyogenes]VHD33367.1 Uncharacterised protein [Streptococcus pyogenes]
MINFKKLFKKPKKEVGLFSESPLKTSFYEELQKNGWCELISDSPDDLKKFVKIDIKRTQRIK